MRYLVLLAALLCAPGAWAQSPAQQEPASVRALREQDAALVKLHAIQDACMALHISADKDACAIKAERGMTEASAYIATVSPKEQRKICDLLGTEARAGCEQEPTLAEAFLFASMQICDGCVARTGTYEELHNARYSRFLHQNDVLSTLVQEKRAELASLAQQVEDSQRALAEQTAAAQQLAASAEKIKSCKEAAKPLLPLKDTKKKKG